MTAHAARVERDCIHALYRQGPLASGIALVMGAVIAAAAWSEVPIAWLVAWYGLVVANQAVRLLLWRAFHRENPQDARIAVWARRYTVGMAVGGGLFGLTALLLPQASAPLQAFLMIMVSGMAAGSVSANAYHRPAMIAYLAAILAPPLAVLVFLASTRDTLDYGLLAFAYLFYFIVMQGFGRNQSEVLRRSIEFGHRNDDLVAELREKTALAESAQRTAEQASHAKSQFFAAASHDLRQPLQALGLFAASLRESRRDPDDARRVDQILASVDVLESLFDELLDISRLDAGQVKPEPRHFPATQLFDRLESVYAPIAQQRGLALRFEPSDAVLHSDPVLLERVLGNLLSNALRYTPTGSVTVRCTPRAERVLLEVVDTGPGIPVEEHERVFDEFYQIGNPERDRRKGLGLGLATVKRIAQLLETRISLHSAPGRGSTFGLDVPRGDAGLIATALTPPAADDLDVLRGRRIVVIDDERDVREGLTELLRLWRCEVVAAGTAAEALERLGDTRPDALIVDYRLREGSTGIKAIEAVRERHGAALPALVMTGDAGPEMFQRLRELGLPMLSKPVRAARLRATLQHLLGAARKAA